MSSVVKFGIDQQHTSINASDLALAFRFGVYFFAGGAIPNPLDIRFQKVSGIGGRVETARVEEGGQNLYTHRLPGRIGYENLVLERGLVVGSPLNVEVGVALSLFQFQASNVLVTLFNEQSVPLAGWLFLKTYPVSWKTSDLDATQKAVVIDTLELAYTRMQALRI